MVDIVKEDGRTPPTTPTPGWANFSIMMECTPESGHCPSVCTLWAQIAKISLQFRVANGIWPIDPNSRAIYSKL
jgi:hypothetical protein